MQGIERCVRVVWARNKLGVSNAAHVLLFLTCITKKVEHVNSGLPTTAAPAPSTHRVGTHMQGTPARRMRGWQGPR